MRCSKTFELLSRKLDKRLSHRERETLRRHLESCSSCREVQAKMEADSLNLKRVMHFSKPNVQQFVARTMAYITEMEEPHSPEYSESAGSRRRFGTPWVWVQTAALAASVLAVTYFLFQEKDLERQVNDLMAQVDEAREEGRTEGRRLAQIEMEQLPTMDTREADAHASLPTPFEGEITGDMTIDTSEPLGSDGGSTEPGVDLASELMLAIESQNADEIARVAAILLELQQQSERASEMLRESYLGEEQSDRKAQLLEIMSQFPSETNQEFFLAQLFEETEIPLRRALTDAMNASMLRDDSLALSQAAIDELKVLAFSDDNDWQVRANAGKALVVSAYSDGNTDLLQEIRLSIEASNDNRYRDEVVYALAQNLDRTAYDSMVDDAGEYLADYVGHDFSLAERVIEGLEKSRDTATGIRMLDRIQHRLKDGSGLRKRWSVARELLGDIEKSMTEQ